jgi:hypothetical protein
MKRKVRTIMMMEDSIIVTYAFKYRLLITHLKNLSSTPRYLDQYEYHAIQLAQDSDE